MNFEYPEIATCDLNDPNEIVWLIEKLCGQDINPSQRQLEHLANSIGSLNLLEYEHFNELLLLLNQARISSHFFEYFFSSTVPKLPTIQLRDGVVKFCGFAMLCYGNFRFAYKELNELPPNLFHKKVLEFDPKTGAERITNLTARVAPTFSLTKIPKHETWFTGFLSTGHLEKDKQALYALALKLGLVTKTEVEETIRYQKPDKADKILSDMWRKAENIDPEAWEGRFQEIQHELEKLDNALERTRIDAEENTNTYLNWEYIDIYFATSMRQRWEFEAVFDFIDDVFKQAVLQDLKLRYFDPTQSFTSDRINKGLLEGLMLNRARLTVYLAQETDTLGKDSELAATLAQGKPVIAYVPKADDKYWTQLPRQPIDYFWKRSLLLDAEDAFKDENCDSELNQKIGADWVDKLENHLDKVSQYLKKRVFYLAGGEDSEFKTEQAEMFQELCTIIGTAEKHYFEKRTDLLSRRHPLAIQVNLRTGVANGVLVVRDAQTCAHLIQEILSNQMHFTIVKEHGVTQLREDRSKCPYRVVTDDETLTNSFWNFYLTERVQKG